MTKSTSLIAAVAVVLAGLVIYLFVRIERLETRVEGMSNALSTLDPLRSVLAQVRPRADAYQPAQATGEPDVPMQVGDSGAAWCPAEENGGTEWLLLTYAVAVTARAVEVHANFNPGAVVRVLSVEDDGVETELWQGAAQPNGASTVSVLTFHAPTTLRRVKLIFDTQAVPGWNEIDAVALVTNAGDKHWAAQAEASSVWRSAVPR